MIRRRLNPEGNRDLVERYNHEPEDLYSLLRLP